MQSVLEQTPAAAAPATKQPRRAFSIFILHPSMWLTNHQPSGDGLLAYELLTRLAARGHQIHAAVSLQSIQGAVPANLHLHDIPTVAAASPFGASPANRVEFGFRASQLFRSLDRTVHFDLAHQLNPVLYGLSFFARLPVPLVMGPVPPAWPPGTEHAETFRRKLINRIKPACQSLQYRYAHTVLAANKTAARHLLAAHVPAERVKVLPFGIDPAVFSDVGPSGVREPLPAQPTILFLSNLWKRKGIFTLLEAFAKVHEALPTARLLIGGSGSDEDAVRAAVNLHRHRGAIEMLGRIPRADVPATLRRATVFCLPSFGEPCGTAALEAMSCGRAVILTETGGVSDLLPDGAPWVIPQRDAAALTHALLEALTDPAQTAAIGQQNREQVINHFAWERVLDRLEDIYSSCISEEHTP